MKKCWWKKNGKYVEKRNCLKWWCMNRRPRVWKKNEEIKRKNNVEEEDSEEMRMKNTWFVLFGVQKTKEGEGEKKRRKKKTQEESEENKVLWYKNERTMEKNEESVENQEGSEENKVLWYKKTSEEGRKTKEA